MGLIGRWIDEKCRTHPEVMRRVLGRKFGDLVEFVSIDGKCGCLVGSWEIESNAESGWRLPAEKEVGQKVWLLTQHGPFIIIDGLLLPTQRRRKRPDAFVIRLLKQRIRRALGLTLHDLTDEAQAVDFESVSNAVPTLTAEVSHVSTV